MLKVTGRMPYAADLRIPDMLFAAAARSPHPHARILAVDTSAAKLLPGVKAVLTGADVANLRTGRGVRDVPLLAVGKARFVGEMVAAVAAISSAIADQAARLITVEYEPLDAVFDPLEALAPDAPAVHDEPWAYDRAARNESGPRNMISRVERKVGGDIELGLSEADRVFEHTFVTPKLHQGYLEPHCCIAQFNADATVNVWSCNKSPYTLRAQLASTFDLPLENIVIHTAAIGGDFGAKGGPLEVPLCLELSRRTGRPVRMLRTYADELTAGTPAPASVSTIRMGVRHDGRIQAFQMRTVLNAGAYGGYAASDLARMIGGTAYRLPIADVEIVRAYTNEVSNGSMRAPGAMQVVFATEAMMDHVAHQLHLDPFEFRRRNLLRTDETSVTGHCWPERRANQLLDLAEQACAPLLTQHAGSSCRVGRGIAVFDRPTHEPMRTSLRLRLTNGGIVEALVPIQETGTGSHTVAQRVLASELGVGPEWIVIRYASTEHLPYDFGVGGQMVTGSVTNICVEAARAFSSRLGACAAQVLDCDASTLRFDAGCFWAADGRSVDLAALSQACPGLEITAESGAMSVNEGGVISCAVQVAQVVVDLETGQIRVTDFVSAHDVAEIIDPVSHRGQVDGGFAMGLGFALTEDLSIVDGRVTASHLGDYKLPSIADMPSLRVVLLGGGQGVGPLNTKAIGEMGNVGVAPAIANAVSDALDFCMDSLPLTAEKVLAAAGHQHVVMR
jgi:CO/xanthine dehydrogenase Mo-binding subunit